MYQSNPAGDSFQSSYAQRMGPRQARQRFARAYDPPQMTQDEEQDESLGLVPPEPPPPPRVTPGPLPSAIRGGAGQGQRRQPPTGPLADAIAGGGIPRGEVQGGSWHSDGAGGWYPSGNPPVPPPGPRSPRRPLLPMDGPADVGLDAPMRRIPDSETQWSADQLEEVRRAYETYLGRTPGEDELRPHLGNPGGLQGALRTIQQSPEAEEYATSVFAAADAPPAGGSGGSTGTTPPPTYDTSQWNTEGWATPQYLGTAAGGPMAGWDQTNWDDGNMQTPKYVVGRILSNYPASPNGLRAALPEIAKAYPGTTIVEHPTGDQLNIPGLGVIDVGVAFDGSNPDAVTEWAWQDLTNDPGMSGPGTPLTAAVGGTPLSGTDPALAALAAEYGIDQNSPIWQQIMAALAGQTGQTY